MIAARHLKYAARVGKSTLLDVLDPGPIHAHRHLVLCLACHRAGVTSDALAVIDYEAVFHPRGLDPKQSIILGSARNGSDVVELAGGEPGAPPGGRGARPYTAVAVLDLIVDIFNNPL